MGGTVVDGTVVDATVVDGTVVDVTPDPRSAPDPAAALQRRPGDHPVG
jgi:hypothetical protein